MILPYVSYPDGICPLWILSKPFEIFGFRICENESTEIIEIYLLPSMINMPKSCLQNYGVSKFIIQDQSIVILPKTYASSHDLLRNVWEIEVGF